MCPLAERQAVTARRRDSIPVEDVDVTAWGSATGDLLGPWSMLGDGVPVPGGAKNR